MAIKKTNTRDNMRTTKKAAPGLKAPKLSRDEKYRLYLGSVQNPAADIDFINKEFKSLYGKTPLTLREDFCGTGMMACEWVEQSDKHRAFGIDLDMEPLSFGVVNHYDDLDEEEQTRMKYINGNVMSNYDFKTDVIVAFNFSYYLFKKRADLLKYFTQARKHLKKDGAFFIDLFGGTEARQELEESVKHKTHTYYWDCSKYNPLTAECLYYIHFKTSDGIKHEKVFTYDWRMWDARELLDILEEAGFSKTHIYWEGVDKDGSGNGKFKKATKADNCESWVTYICAQP
ncbi:MAG: class I SAM-dependent methyltransferase [Bdellovibrionales bacterium]|nr:class I SAM-dependent methyltransferase [Bdellovibrionales bacterium]